MNNTPRQEITDVINSLVSLDITNTESINSYLTTLTVNISYLESSIEHSETSPIVIVIRRKIVLLRTVEAFLRIELRRISS